MYYIYIYVYIRGFSSLVSSCVLSYDELWLVYHDIPWTETWKGAEVYKWQANREYNMDRDNILYLRCGTG